MTTSCLPSWIIVLSPSPSLPENCPGNKIFQILPFLIIIIIQFFFFFFNEMQASFLWSVKTNFSQDMLCSTLSEPEPLTLGCFRLDMLLS